MIDTVRTSIYPKGCGVLKSVVYRQTQTMWLYCVH